MNEGRGDPATLALRIVRATEPRMSPDGRTVVFRRAAVVSDTMRDERQMRAPTMAGRAGHPTGSGWRSSRCVTGSTASVCCQPNAPASRER
jgi:hypothetical protein